MGREVKRYEMEVSLTIHIFAESEELARDKAADLEFPNYVGDTFDINHVVENEIEDGDDRE